MFMHVNIWITCRLDFLISRIVVGGDGGAPFIQFQYLTNQPLSKSNRKEEPVDTFLTNSVPATMVVAYLMPNIYGCLFPLVQMDCARFQWFDCIYPSIRMLRICTAKDWIPAELGERLELSRRNPELGRESGNHNINRGESRSRNHYIVNYSLDWLISTVSFVPFRLFCVAHCKSCTCKLPAARKV